MLDMGSLDIDYKKLSIGESFKSHYTVPDYQREYVWEDENLEQLFDDIVSSYEENSGKSYFTGMTVVYENESKYELIDGQQRMTTFFILLCVIIDFYKQHGEDASVYKTAIYSPALKQDGTSEDSYRLELQYTDSKDCLDNIFNGKIPSEAEREALSDSDKRLYNAYFTIRRLLLKEFPDFSDLKRFSVFVFNEIKFVQIETKDISDALKIFETINQRGVSLNSMDLLKNMIFMQVDRSEFAGLNKKWKDIITKIEDNDEKPLRFLRYYLSATYDITDKTTGKIKGILPENSIYKWLSENNQQCKYKEDPFGFVNRLAEGLDRYMSFCKPNPVGIGNSYLRNIPRLAGSSFRLHLTLLLSAVEMSKNTLDKFEQVVEAIVFYATVDSIKANELERIFPTWCPQIRRIKDENDLKVFIENSVKPIIDKWKFERNHKQRFIYMDLQLYRMRCILARISKYINEIRSGGNNFADIEYEYGKSVQIEHIMPQKIDDYTLYGIDIDDKEGYEKYLNSLGNLTLLEKAINQACQNKSYEDKCKEYPKSKFYLTSSLPSLINVGVNTAANKLNGKMRCWDKWVKDSIEERQEMLYELSEMIWNIDNIVDSWD